MSAPASDEVLRELVRRGLPEGEGLTKRGRARRLVLERDGEVSAFSQEQAWAVRASSRRASFFAAGAGELPGGDGGASGGPHAAGGASDGPHAAGGAVVPGASAARGGAGRPGGSGDPWPEATG